MFVTARWQRYGSICSCSYGSVKSTVCRLGLRVLNLKMGNNFTINMEENFKKNQDFITEMNNIKVETLYTYWCLDINIIITICTDWTPIANEKPNEGKASGFGNCETARAFLLGWNFLCCKRCGKLGLVKTSCHIRPIWT